MDERDQGQKNEEHADQAEAPDALEDLDVSEEDSENVKGGTYSFKQGWPKKYEGS